VLSGVALGVVALLGVLAANAVSSTSTRTDPPLKSQTYNDPPSDAPSGAPDIASVTAENWSDGTIGFKISIPKDTTLSGNQGIGIYMDTDLNRATGQMGDDYFIAAEGQYTTNPTYELLKWTGSTWTHMDSPTLQGEFHSFDGVTVTMAKSEIGIGASLNFDVWASAIVSGFVNSDQAPDSGFYTYTLGVPTPTTTTTPPPTTTVSTPLEHFAGFVGPGARIAFVHSAVAGKATITINDLTRKDNFHLVGPGVNRKTGVAFKGKVVWAVTLKKGTYSFRSDAHAALHGTMRVSS
jgi:hypothetical protein